MKLKNLGWLILGLSVTVSCITEPRHLKIVPQVGPIPKKIHQIWIGTAETPSYFEVYRESFAKFAPDFEYRLWTNKDITRENFPLTYDHLMEVSRVGKDIFGPNPKMWEGTPVKKLAQIADLMRLEIIYHHGGFYFDVKAELIGSLDALVRREISFYVVNEDPCGLGCDNKGKYLANAFFASIPKHPILARLLDPGRLYALDFTDSRLNRVTGPFYLRSGILAPIEVEVGETDWIYPYIRWHSRYRKPKQDLCLSERRAEVAGDGVGVTIKEFTHKGRRIYARVPCDRYPKSTAVMHWVLGGTWLKH